MALFGSTSKIAARPQDPLAAPAPPAGLTLADVARQAGYINGVPPVVPDDYLTAPRRDPSTAPGDQETLRRIQAKMDSGQTLTQEELGLMAQLGGDQGKQAIEAYRHQQDPTYGMTPEQATEYGKNQALQDRFGGYYSFLDPAFQMQPTLLGQSARSQAGPTQASQLAQYQGLAQAAGLSTKDLEFMSPAQQQALLGQWAGVQAGQGAPDFSQAGARQQEQYGNLGEIIAGGGADAIELARRMRARQDSEAWLRGQREADMADYAERGLTGSGMELQNLAMDRQAAAGRNSLADAEMAAELEKRKMDAINQAAGLAGQMRGAEFSEKGYLDQRAINALNEQTDLASLMRNQQASESVANRSAQQSALDAFLSNAGRVREAEAGESQFRATGADDFAKWNANNLNTINMDYTTYLRDQRDQALKMQQDWALEKLRTGVDVAQGLQSGAQRENAIGFGQGTQLGTNDAAARNAAKDAWNATYTNAFTGGTAGDLAAQLTRNALIPKTTGYVGAVGDEIAKWWSGYGMMDTSSPGGTSGGTGGATGGGTGTSAPKQNFPGAIAGDFDWFNKMGL